MRLLFLGILISVTSSFLYGQVIGGLGEPKISANYRAMAAGNRSVAAQYRSVGCSAHASCQLAVAAYHDCLADALGQNPRRCVQPTCESSLPTCANRSGSGGRPVAQSTTPNRRIDSNNQRATEIMNAVAPLLQMLLNRNNDADEARLRDIEERQRQAEEDRQLEYEASVRRDAEESARRMRQGAYNQNLLNEDGAARENEDLSKAIERRMAENEMVNPASEIFGADGDSAVSEVEEYGSRAANNSIMDLADRIEYNRIAPPKGSIYEEAFDAVTNEAFDTATEMILDKMSGDTGEDFAERSTYDRVQDFFKGRVLDRAQDELEKLYAKVKTKGSTDAFELGNAEIEGAAHPFVGLAPRILRNGLKLPKSLVQYGYNLSNKIGAYLGLAETTFFPERP